MRLWIVSDLHIGRGFFWAPEIPEHDVMVIAGDLAEDYIDALLRLHGLSRWSTAPVVFIPGNHDLFGAQIDDWDGENRRLDDAGVHVLSSGQSVIIDGTRFVGGTLWTDFALADDVYGSEAWAAKSMPEYLHVRRGDGALIWPADTREAHLHHRAAIEAVLATPHDGPTIVITHHAPSRKSIAGEITAADAAFASDLDDMILRHQPEVWVHGHIHQHSDYAVGSTRVLSNPRGYQSSEWSEKTGFVEDLVFEI